MDKLKIIFMGTSGFAVSVLEALHYGGFIPVMVITKPDSIRSRGKKILPPPVKEKARSLGISVSQPEKMDRQTIAFLKGLSPDLIITAAYGLLLPQSVLEIPFLGCINVHPSMLPLYRGAAPIQRALMSGETETGVSIYLMNRGMDTGPLITQEKISIDPEDDAGSLSERLAGLSGKMLVDVIPRWVSGDIKPFPQQGEPTYAPRISRSEEGLNWAESADALRNQIRGLSPVPGAYTFYKSRRVKIFSAEVLPGAGMPGEIITADDTLSIGTARDILSLQKVQPEGRRMMDAADFVRGYRLKPGDYLGEKE